MSSWYGQIDGATSVEEVVAIVRDYIALWSPEEIGLLAPAVRPGRVRDTADVTDLHARLVEEFRTTRVSGEALACLQRMTAFLVRASQRIAQLGPVDSGEERREDGASTREASSRAGS